MTTETMALPKEKTALPAEKFGIEDYAGTFRETRNAYQQQANELEQATGPDPSREREQRGAPARAALQQGRT